MTRLSIKLEKNDILTRKFEDGVMVAGKNIDIVFSKDAIEELVKDYNTLTNGISLNSSIKVHE